MTENHIWLSTSLFCNKFHWNDILFNGIKPFLDHITHKKQLSRYEIAFDYSGGDNIRLALGTQHKYAEELAKETDEYFKKLFLQKDYPKQESVYFDSIFMPFPVNSIQYGLYKPVPVSESGNTLPYRFKKTISNMILNVLPDDTIDEEKILLFAFYLNIIYIKTLTKNNYNIDLTSFYQQNFVKKGVSITEDTLTETYEENKEILHEITADIFNPETLEDNQIFQFGDWIKLCEEDVTTGIHASKEYSAIHYTNYLRTFYLITRQLAITDNMTAMLLYFIRQLSLPKSLDLSA